MIGLRNLLLCQLVARGPVSDSPSPTITRAIRSGWVVGRHVGVRDAVAQFAAFVDAAGGFWRGVAADAAREGKLLEKALQPRCVFALFRVDLGICPFEIRLGQYSGRPVPRATDVDRVEVVLFDQPVEVGVGKALTGVRTPMAEQPRLYLLQGQRLSQQGV